MSEQGWAINLFKLHSMRLLCSLGHLASSPPTSSRSYSRKGTLSGLPSDRSPRQTTSRACIRSKVSLAIVQGIAAPNAFDEVKEVDVVVHTASPFHFNNVTDPVKDLLDTAFNGTTSTLQATKNFAPQVKRVVITSSSAAIMDPKMGNRPEHTYSGADWNPM
ncbi:hypothetical protein V1527DRAFT_242675 [Lipomyces starkeyi]